MGTVNMKRKIPGSAQDGEGDWPDRGGIGGLDDETELLLLALLEQVQIDQARGSVRDLASYCADYPELGDIFLEMAEVIDPTTSALYMTETPRHASPRAPLSPGVLRALSQISAADPRRSDQPLERKIAEARIPYSLDGDDE